MTLRRYVLILHAGALGDFVLTWPLALALARLSPQQRIVYVTHSEKGKLAARVLGVESADVEVGGWHRLHSAGGFSPGDLTDPAKKLLANTAAVYDFAAGAQRDSDVRASNLRAAVGDAEVPIVPLRPRPLDRAAGVPPVHALDDLLAQLAGRPVVAEGVRAVRNLMATRGLDARRYAKGAVDPSLVVIHPGSGGAAKCWPASDFAAVARRLVEAGRRVRVTLGEVERERMPDADAAAFESAGAEVSWPGDLLGLLDAVLPASAFVGNDSGPGHLAAAVGVPTVSIFTATDPAVWRPTGPDVTVLGGGVRVTPDDVAAAVLSPSPLGGGTGGTPPG